MKREAEGRRSGQTLHEEIELRPAGGVRAATRRPGWTRASQRRQRWRKDRETPEGVAAAGYQRQVPDGPA